MCMINMAWFIGVFVGICLSQVAALPDCSYTHEEGVALYGFNNIVLNDSNVNDCMQRCDAEEDQCKSFDYDKKSRTCMLSGESHLTYPTLLGKHSHMDYYYKESCSDEETAVETGCRETERGQEYLGSISVTVNGRTCQAWTEQTPHQHSMDPNDFADGSLSAAENYCRNPDNEPGGLWCYTTDSDVRWEYCPVPYCENECKQSERGQEYVGSVSVTLSGRSCQAWTQQTPHSHSMAQYYFPDGSMSAAQNFCRNPDNEPGGPWCYTADSGTRWEYCDIPDCS